MRAGSFVSGFFCKIVRWRLNFVAADRDRGAVTSAAKSQTAASRHADQNVQAAAKLRAVTGGDLFCGRQVAKEHFHILPTGGKGGEGAEEDKR